MKTKQIMTLLISALFVCMSSNIQAQKADWKEMHAFHSVMSKTFHPAEEGNLQPVKEHAKELVAKAKSWQSSSVPVGFNATKSKEILKRLVTKCTAIEAAVKAKKSDDSLKTMITEAHEIFHELMEKCRE
jgi:hypothetical protein